MTKHLDRRAADHSTDIRVRALFDILQPFIVPQINDITVEMVLDDMIWQRASRCLEQILRASCPDMSITCSVADSRRMPGLQVADVVSGITRRYLRTGDSPEAFSLIGRRILTRLPEIELEE
jgi:hypothetical protein